MPVDVIVGPGNVYVAVAKREVAGVGRRAVGLRRAVRDRGRRRRLGRPPAFAAIDVIVQAEHGPDGLAWLITWSPEAADAIDAEHRPPGRGGPSPRRHRAQLRPGRLRCRWSTGPSRPSRWPTSSPPSTSQLMTADPEALVPAGPPRRRRVLRAAGSPASIGDYLAGPSHVLPTFGSARFGSALTVDDFVKQVHVVTVDQRRLRAGRPVRRDPRRPPRASTPTPSRSGSGSPRSRPESRSDRVIRPRDDVALMEGYHSPQVDVEVRLNTNESPTRRRPSGVGRLRRRPSTTIDWHRYPDRAATDLRAAIAELHGVDPDQVFVANGSNEVLQTAAAHLRRRRAARRPCSSPPTRCTPTSPGSPAPRWCEGERAADFVHRPRRGAAGVRRAPRRRSPSCARPTTPPAWSTTRRRSGPCST